MALRLGVLGGWCSRARRSPGRSDRLTELRNPAASAISGLRMRCIAMPEPNTNWFFQPRSHRDGEGREDDSAPGLISLPAEVLQRHGAQILDPQTAVAVDSAEDESSPVQ